MSKIKLFGQTLAETKRTLETGVHLGPDQVTQEDRVKVIGRIIVTVVMIFLATYLFTQNKDTVAGTIVGAVIGYWIK